MGITALVDINLDLLSVGVAIAGILLLGSIIFFNNPKSITNRTFLYFAILTAIWGISNYLEYRFVTVEATLWALRFHLFLSTIHAFFFLRLAYVFPREEVEFPPWYHYVLIPVVATGALLTLTPFVFSGITTLAPAGQVTRATPGPGIILFMLIAFGCLLLGLALLFKRLYRAAGIERKQDIALFIGMVLTAVLILAFNVVLPNVFANLSFIPLAALFILPFIGLTSYAIYRHHLFDLKVAATAFLGFMVTIFTFVNVVYSTSASAVVINVAAFAIVLLGSIKIVRDTLALQLLTEELSETNTRQEGLIHFIGHEVKGFLTKAEGAFAALDQGDFGVLPDALKPFVQEALKETRDGVGSVSDILKAANQKKGTVSYEMAPFDLKALVAESVEKARSAATAKGLQLTFTADEAQTYQFTGDKVQLADHVLRNLIDNAVNYTPSGSVAISLAKQAGKYVFAVKDSGVGISDEDKARLFTEGGHGKDSIKVNVHSTGYGLFIAKNVTEAHRGTIRAESEGPGKGSTFVVELPVQ